jgi:hypothetical protein
MPANSTLVIDTGPIVALLDRSERNHAACVEVMRNWRGTLATSEAVLTEATHLLAEVHDGQQRCLELFTRGGIVLVPPTLKSLARSAELMRKYRDVPMDYADATLVSLCEELNVARVFTLDRRGFGVYRASGRKTFDVLP